MLIFNLEYSDLMNTILEKLNLRSDNQLRLNDEDFLNFKTYIHPDARKAAVCIGLFKKEDTLHIGMIKRNK